MYSFTQQILIECLLYDRNHVLLPFNLHTWDFLEALKSIVLCNLYPDKCIVTTLLHLSHSDSTCLTCAFFLLEEIHFKQMWGKVTAFEIFVVWVSATTGNIRDIIWFPNWNGISETSLIVQVFKLLCSQCVCLHCFIIYTSEFQLIF